MVALRDNPLMLVAPAGLTDAEAKEWAQGFVDKFRPGGVTWTYYEYVADWHISAERAWLRRSNHSWTVAAPWESKNTLQAQVSEPGSMRVSAIADAIPRSTTELGYVVLIPTGVPIK